MFSLRTDTNPQERSLRLIDRTRAAGSAIGTRCARRALEVHRDERGALSVMGVVVVLALTMILGMLLNVGKHIDDKIKMQNAADAAAYSGGLVVARGMNALSFSNHLLCDTCALTAFLREARDRNAESMVPEILAAWTNIGGIFAGSEFPKFRTLGSAIKDRVPDEQEVVRTYGEMGSAISAEVLPVLEYVLLERLIPEFQRSVVRTMPLVAQATTNDLASRHSIHRNLQQNRRELRTRGPQVGVLWRTTVMPVGYPDEQDPQTRTLPAVDPEPGEALGQSQPVSDPTPDGLEGIDYKTLPSPTIYLQLAIQQREQLSKMYLRQWIDDRLRFFAVEGKKSQYINLYHVFACGQLMRLLNEEYPYTNLPHMIRLTESGSDRDLYRFCDSCQGAASTYLDRNFMFVGVVYRAPVLEAVSGLFKYPLSHDSLAFTQVEVFVPRARMWYHEGAGESRPPDIGGGGVGVDVNIPLDPPPTPAVPPGWSHEGWPADWSLLTQNWTVKLVPATNDCIAQVLQTRPPPGAIAT
ncbi:MAG: hypothetical protein EHM42_09780, partial [Planctomycetaceae bacterium]